MNLSFLYCVVYLAVMGVAAHFIGEALPRERFDPDRFPFRQWKWEKDGRVYAALRVKWWKDKVPDMSRFMPDMLPKRMEPGEGRDKTRSLILEGCVAEAVHAAECLLGLACPFIWRGAGGIILAAVWILFGNLPFIIIQRYNRPRLVSLEKRQAKRGEKKGDL